MSNLVFYKPFLRMLSNFRNLVGRHNCCLSDADLSVFVKNNIPKFVLQNILSYVLFFFSFGESKFYV